MKRFTFDWRNPFGYLIAKVLFTLKSGEVMKTPTWGSSLKMNKVSQLKFYYSILWFKIAFTVLTHLFIQNTVRLTGIEIKHMFDWFARNSNQDLLNCYASHSFLFSMLNLKWVKLLVRILKNKNDFFQKITEEVSKNHNKN